MRRAFLLCAIAVFVYALIAFSFAGYFLYFSTSEQANNYAQTAYPIFVELFVGPFGTIWRFILSHPELITALATIFIGWFTYALVRATKELTRIADQAEASSRTVERAYVTMVDIPPGVHVSVNRFTITVKIQNFGRTPAEISDAPINSFVIDAGDRLPAQPPYGQPTVDSEAVHAFLVSDHHFTTTTIGSDDDQTMTGQVAEAIHKGTKILHFVGYVDYIDKFGVRHRTGYGRRYNHAAPVGQLNLIFITQHGYNYDRERKKGEGNDWGVSSSGQSPK